MTFGAEQIAARLGQILSETHLSTGDSSPPDLTVTRTRDGWRAQAKARPGTRAQAISWSFGPNGDLRLHPSRDRLVWNRCFGDDEVQELLRRWGRPIT